jgi:long-chain acyl-CoA synthetase
MNLTELLDRTARRWPDKAAFIEENLTVSYGALAAQVAAWAEKLQRIDLPPGSRVGLQYPNSVQYVALTFALWHVQAVVVPLPTECTAEEIAEITTAMELAGRLSPAPAETAVPLGPDCFFTKFHPPQPPDNHGLNLAFIRFTSGTTSARKGVALAHETIRDRVTSANRAFGIGPDDTVIWCLPMAHHFLITIVLYLSVGATVVLARHVLAKPFLEAINRWKGTVLYAAPFHFAMLARDNSELKVTSVRLAVSTTCALPQSVAEDFYRRFEISLVQALGVIELGLVSLNTDDPRGRWNSVGRPAGDVRVRIHNPDAEGCGEVAVAGPGIFDAYVAPWVPREQVLRDGEFFTGDIGRMDVDGYLFLLSRQTAVINLAGRKVFPEEIEAVLNRHPAVRESRVYGRAHSHLGEVVEAELVLDPPDANLDSVREFCRVHLAAYKIPTRFTLVAALPRTPVTGKIRRAAAAA